MAKMGKTFEEKEQELYDDLMEEVDGLSDVL
jgi:hypothetical protein